VFSFQDEDGEWLSLRYDLTAPLARYVAANYERLPKPYRSYRWGWVFRNEKPGPGRFRQFMQVDADTVGAASPAADAEICMMAADTMEELGIRRGQYVIKVNSRKVVDGIMDANGIVDPVQRLRVLRAIDKLDRLGPEGVAALLGRGRTDESGDFTEGANLNADQKEAIGFYVRFQIEKSDDERFLDYWEGLARDWRSIIGDSDVGRRGIDELLAIGRLVEASGYADGRVNIDPSVVRGLEYYTGPVFEADLLFEIPNEKGQPVMFGSVGGGGRYDGLVGRFMGEDVPATGFSLGVSRLQAALAALGQIEGAAAAGPVVVLVMDRDRISDYQAMVARLRKADVAAELYLGDAGIKTQMKYADRRNAPLAIIQGSNEKARGVVQIKDLTLGKKLAAEIAAHKEWREQRPGQEEVAEADLVEAVNRLLGRGERRPP
jgi:histidyl-tRNA synthetase